MGWSVNGRMGAQLDIPRISHRSVYLRLEELVRAMAFMEWHDGKDLGPIFRHDAYSSSYRSPQQGFKTSNSSI